jgi:hypothetical protein
MKSAILNLLGLSVESNPFYQPRPELVNKLDFIQNFTSSVHKHDSFQPVLIAQSIKLALEEGFKNLIELNVYGDDVKLSYSGVFRKVHIFELTVDSPCIKASNYLDHIYNAEHTKNTKNGYLVENSLYLSTEFNIFFNEDTQTYKCEVESIKIKSIKDKSKSCCLSELLEYISPNQQNLNLDITFNRVSDILDLWSLIPKSAITDLINPELFFLSA